jgi:hypothetical protein
LWDNSQQPLDQQLYLLLDALIGVFEPRKRASAQCLLQLDKRDLMALA